MRRFTLIAVAVLFVTASLTGQEAAPPPDAETRKSVGELVAKLDASSFAVREEATLSLIRLGVGIRELLEEQLGQSSLEVDRRIRRVLLHFAEVERRAGLAESPDSNWPMLKRGPGRGASSGAATVWSQPQVVWACDLPFRIGEPYFDSPLLADDRRIYVVSRSGRVAAIERESGAIAWSKAIGEPVFAAPVLSEGTIYIPGRSLTAMDTRAGRIRWRWTTDYGVPASPAVHDGRVFAVEKGEKLVCLDPATGDVKWRARVAATSSPPTVMGKLVILGTEDAVRAYAVHNGSRRWTYETTAPVTSAPAAVGETIVVCDSARTLYSLTAKRGRRKWQRRIPEGVVLESPVVYGDTVLFATSGATFRAISAVDGSDRWARFIGNLVQSSPCVAGGVVYFIGGTRIHALLCSDGDDVWRLPLAAGLLCSPILLDGTMHTVTAGGVLLALK